MYHKEANMEIKHIVVDGQRHGSIDGKRSLNDENE